MQLFRICAGAAVIALMPLAASAQEPDQTTTTTTITVDQQTTYDRWGTRGSHWLASGFVGSQFGRDVDSSTVDFGGSIGYLWNGAFGAEFQANFAPDFDLEPNRSALLLGERPSINSYMINAIVALPVGTETRFQPYLSGGLGALTIRADALPDPTGNNISPDDSRMGGNVGVGVLTFARNVGLRADVRYFTGFGDDIIPDFLEPAEGVGNQVLSNLNFWRANVGLAFRW
jgi:opacity protein-like surface antigen